VSTHASQEELEVAQRLVSRLKQRSQTFKDGSNHARLLDLYLAKFPGPATNNEAAQALGGGINPSTPISRLNQDLRRCFHSDRFLWREQQKLALSKMGPDQTHRLQLEWLAETLPASTRIWFHHCLQVAMPQEQGQKHTSGEPQPWIVVSEPLFFFAPALGAYFRFLEINHDSLFRTVETPIVEAAKAELLKIIPQDRDDVGRIHGFVEGLDLVPVRLYLPAGDSYAKTAIRRWFRNNLSHRVGYKSGSDVSVHGSVNWNLIVLASRSSLPLLAEFQQRPELRLRLVEKGIRFDQEFIPDILTVGEGTTLSHVIVTSWMLETGRAHMYIAANHTRALQAVAELLVSDDELLREVSAALVIEGKGKIPSKYQIAFEVRLNLHETNATIQGVLPRLRNKPIVY
jgi:hypothetical protein